MINIISVMRRKKCAYVPVSSVLFAALAALFFVVFYNAAFFVAVHHAVNSFSLGGGFFTLCLAILLWLLTFLFLNFVIVPYLIKPVFVVLTIAAAAVAYFMNTYGIVIHRLMIQNAVETDATEITSLLSFTLLAYLLLLGVIPSVLIIRAQISYAPPLSEIWRKIKTSGLALMIALVLVVSMSAEFTSFFRNHKDIRQRANPLNFIYAGIAYFASNTAPVVVASTGLDASLNPAALAQKKPTLLVVVVGETARADRFGVNGYARDTTPLIAKEAIINYEQVSSCGTETAVSVPCMFSLLGRKHYSDAQAKAQESVLDVIHHAGVLVYWRDNNSSCKGVCDRVTYDNIQHLTVPDICNERECFDAILLHQLTEKLTAINGGIARNSVIFLHQKGSHGPDYYHRYPEGKEFFKPACQTNQLQDCTVEEVNNAYDNSIRYTDHFLAKTIEWLKNNETVYNTAMVYLSDHGESLGENHIYLHGMPYVMAPDAQKHIPFFLWFSPDFMRDNKLDRGCLANNAAKPYSQDNVPHTLLGLLNIRTSVYQAELDMLQGCRDGS